jgi:hypothetical protein
MTFNLISIIDNEYVDASSYVHFDTETRNAIEFEDEEFSDEEFADEEFSDEEFDELSDIEHRANPIFPLKERVFARAFTETLRYNQRVFTPDWVYRFHSDDPIELDLILQEELQQSLIDTIKVSDLIVEELAKLNHKQHFRNHITQERIADAMHPRRMMERINHFDDIETFFDAC